MLCRGELGWKEKMSKPNNIASFRLEKNDATQETVIEILRNIADRLEKGELKAQTAIIILIESDDEKFWTHSFGSGITYREGIAALEITKAVYVDHLLGRD